MPGVFVVYMASFALIDGFISVTLSFKFDSCYLAALCAQQQHGFIDLQQGLTYMYLLVIKETYS